jgi:hypothetical protein
MQKLKTEHCFLHDHGAEYLKRKAEIVNKIRLDSCGSWQKKKILLPLKFCT